MTKSEPASGGEGETTGRCRWCRRVVVQRPGPGRPKQFCSQKCRQWDWVSRQRAADLALGVNEIVIDRDELDRLHDDLYMLSCAAADIERDLAHTKRPTATDLRESLDWLLAATKPLHDREISAPTTPPSNSS